MRVEEIAIRQEVRQMLAEAGINRETLKEMVKNILSEKVDKAINQALHEKDVNGAISREIESCIKKEANKITREEIRRRVTGLFSTMTISVDITDEEGTSITTVK